MTPDLNAGMATVQMRQISSALSNPIPTDKPADSFVQYKGVTNRETLYLSLICD